MQVEAVYRNGQLQFVTPLKIRQDSLRVMVTIPDEAVELNSIHRGIPSEVVEGAREMLARMEAIRKAPMPPDEALPEMTDKQRERIEAMELRDEMILSGSDRKRRSLLVSKTQPNKRFF